MEIYARDQFSGALLSILFGAGLCAYFDIFRIFRRALPHPKLLTFIEDVFHMASSGLLFVFLTFAVNYGSVRLTYFIGTVLGFLLWYNSFSRTYIKLFEKLIFFIRKIILKLLRLIQKPLKKLLQVISPRLLLFLSNRRLHREEKRLFNNILKFYNI